MLGVEANADVFMDHLSACLKRVRGFHEEYL